MSKTIYILALVFLISCDKNTQKKDSQKTDKVNVPNKETEVKNLIKEEKTIVNIETKQDKLKKIVPDYFEINQKEFEEFKTDNSKWFFSITEKNRLYFVPYTDYSITTAILTNTELTNNESIKLLKSEGIKIHNTDKVIKVNKIKSKKGIKLGLTENKVKFIFGEPDSENITKTKTILKWNFEMLEENSEEKIGGLKPFILNGLEFEVEMEFKKQILTKLVYKYEVP